MKQEKQKKQSQTTPKAAKKVQKRKPKRILFPSDAESIERRRKSDVEDALPPRTDKNFFVPMTREQRIARAWRKHQPRSVRVINLVTENSIEHAMLGKLAYKTALADSVLDGAAFEVPAKTETGRRAYAERVSALLSGEPEQASKTPSTDVATDGQDLTARLTARHADSILGIEQALKIT